MSATRAAPSGSASAPRTPTFRPASARRAAATLPVAQPPGNLSAPNTPSGTLLDSYVLTADTGTWDTPGTTFAYQWVRCPAASTHVDASCTSIGTGAQTYTLAGADVGYRIAVKVTGTSAGGSSAPAVSALTGVVAGRTLQNIVQPSISGTPQVSQALHANPGSWNITPSSVAYGWQRCDADGASNCTTVETGSATYTLSGADDNHAIVLYATASSPGQNVTAHSPPLTIQAQPLPQNTVAPSVSGNPVA